MDFIIGIQEGQSNWREANSYPKLDSRGARIVVFCCGAVANMYSLHCYRKDMLVITGSHTSLIAWGHGGVGLGRVQIVVVRTDGCDLLRGLLDY